MAYKRVIKYQKLLSVQNANKYGSIIIIWEGGRRPKRLDLQLNEFLSLSHMLENDNVFYEPQTRLFASQYEQPKFTAPTNLRPIT